MGRVVCADSCVCFETVAQHRSSASAHPCVQIRAEYSSSSPMNRYGSSGSNGTSCGQTGRRAVIAMR